MGDSFDEADVRRFIDSIQGKRSLKKFRDSLIGKRIAEVEFIQHSAGVGITLILEDGDYLDLMEAIAAFSVETLRDRYKRVLDAAYDSEFPQRRPR